MKNSFSEKSLLTRFINLLLYGHFWIAGAALMMSIQTQWLLVGEWSWSALDAFIATGTLTIYALHRLVAMRLSDGRHDGRFLVMQRYRRHIIVYALAAALVAAYVYFQLPLSLQLSLLVPNLIALGYVIPLLNGRRLRDFPYVKIFLIALAWAWITVVAPARALGLPFDRAVMTMACERAFFIFAITIPFDIRDLSLDRGAEVGTLPGLFGIANAKRVALSALVVMMLCVFYNYQIGYYTLVNTLALVLSVLVSWRLIEAARVDRHDYYYTGLLDGTMILQGGLVILLSFFG